MQTTIYFGDGDRYLLDLLDALARQERKSRSSMILTILEQHFERDRRVGEILIDIGAASSEHVERALRAQQAQSEWRPLGEIMIEQGSVSHQDVDRALLIQARSRLKPSSRAY